MSHTTIRPSDQSAWDRRLSCVDRAMRLAADAVERDVACICEELADALIREVDAISGDAQSRADIIRRGHAGVLASVQECRGGFSTEKRKAPPEASSYARAVARRGLPLDVFLRIHRVSFGVTLRAWDDRLHTVCDPDVLHEASRCLIDRLFASHDALVERLSVEYQRERESFVRSADALRAELIARLLDPEPVSVDRAEAVLRYELRRCHIGLVLWIPSSEDREASSARLARAAAVAAERLGASRPLLHPTGASAMWAWLGLHTAPPADTLECFVAQGDPDGVSIAMGSPGAGAAGFRDSHRDALEASRIAKLTGRRAGSVTPYRSVELVALLSDDMQRTRRFVLAQLGPLAGSGDELARLRATLLTYLEESGGRLATARRLGVHPNTVSNRMRACRELLELDLNPRSVRLQVALGLAASLGAAVLDITTDSRAR